ncbi:Fatty acid synthase [Halotydeus destructor]|nr:Fatty acid synthase [Halotydeus destructor]
MVTADDTRWPIGFFNLPPRNGKIKSIEKFDAEFFDIPKEHANLVDPQERILLELTYEALVDAGVDPNSLKGSNTGVYMGQCFVETHEDFDDPNKAPEMMRQSVTRISNHFEFKGPVLLVDTACGSSLSAFNEAFLALRFGTCDQAIVCGSNTLFRPRVSLQFKDLKMTSKDGVCKCLDEGANGYVRSEAAIVVYLQRAKDSKRIYAKVLNSKSNSDGFKEEGITFPSRRSQAKLCRETYEEAGIDVNDIHYIEAHVTGTSAGDPVEMGAVYDVICSKKTDPLLIGCLKAAIGHSEGASGLCGLSKAILVLQNRLIPPNLHYQSPNPAIEGLMEMKMVPVIKATPLPGDLIPVNCFGFGGANTHVVLQGHYDETKTNKISGPVPRLVTMCGRTSKSVKHICNKLQSEPMHLTNEFLSILGDFAATASDKMPYRAYTIVSSQGDKTSFMKHEPACATNLPVYLVLRVEESSVNDMTALLRLPHIEKTVMSLQKPLDQFGIHLGRLLSDQNQLSQQQQASTMAATYLKCVAIQIAFIDLLSQLYLKPTGIVAYSVGSLAKGYSDGQLNKEEAITCAYYAGQYIGDAKKMTEAFRKVLGTQNGRTLQIDKLVQAISEQAQGLNGTPKGSFVIEAGLNGLHERGQEKGLTRCPLFNTIKTLGDLYMNGNILAIEKLYPAVSYPLPSTTPSLSSLIKWNHSATWSLKPYLIQNTDTFQTTKKLKFHFDKRVIEDVFLYDHKIDERPLFPATGYLMLVWAAFSKIANFTVLETPIEFRDVVYCRATVMSTSGEETSFEVNVSETNGNFELKEGDAVIVKGNIRVDRSQYVEYVPEPVDDSMLVLPSRDIYKEFRVRGYDYGQYFQGIYEAKANGRHGKVTWRDIISDSTKQALNLELEAEVANLWLRSWVPFVDAMFQLDILKEENDSRSLFVPTRIESIKCNPLRLRQNIEHSAKFLDPLTMSHSSLLDVHGRFDNIIWTDGLVVKGLKTSLLKRRQQQPRLFRYSMMPYNHYNSLSIDGRKRVDLYLDACQNALNGNLVEKSAFDLNDNRHSLLRSIMLGSTDVTDLSQDLLVGAVEDNCNYNPNALYSFLDMAVTNMELAVDKVNFDMLEVTSSKQLMHGSFRYCFPDILVKDLVHFNYSLLHPTPEEVDAGDKDGLKEIVQWNESGLQTLPSQNFIIFKCDKIAMATEMLPKLMTALKDGGFLLVAYKAKIESEAASDILRTLNLKLDYMDYDELKAVGEQLGLVYCCDKRPYETVLPVGFMMFRRRNTKILLEKTRVVELGVLDYANWFEKLREMMKEPNEENDKRIWLVSKLDENLSSRLVTGLVGFTKSLRLEENGCQLRCLIDTSVEKVDLSNPKYQRIIEQDLLVNIYDDRVGWGNFMAEDVEKQEIACFHNNNYAYLRSLKQGDMSSLTWVESDIPNKLKTATGSDKTLIEIHYSALNFRDIMFASGKLDSEAIPGIHPNVAQDSILGLEYTGIDVSNNRRIMGITPYKGLATAVHVTKDEEDFIWPIPQDWTMEEAATVPVVYATALYALILRGNLVDGESVLIHSGCGGVGLAAISICMAKGCNVYTTVGSDTKRKYLAEKFPRLVSPVNRIFNSRDVSFESNILKLTDGKGVDVILNSLAEDKLQASLNCLANNGRFLEIGKVDFIQNNPLFVHQLSANQSFHGVLLDALFKYGDHTYLPPRLLAEKKQLKALVLKGIEQGVVRPLNRTVFGKDKVEEAFRYMSTGKHIGKVIVQVRDLQDRKDAKAGLVSRAMKTTYCCPSKSYIVLGGAGGFGLEVVQWLAHKGAKKVIISSRRGLRDPYQFYAVNRLRNKGIKVIISKCDITTMEGAKQLLLEAENEAPVGGIFNAAVVYKDSLFVDQSLEQFKEVCGPKADATLFLDQLSRQLCPELDYFVAFSSLSCGRGNAGQSNYNYANSLMDSVCVDRVANGYPGLSLQWGVIGDVGIVTETSASNDVVLLGTTAQRMFSCLDTIDKCLQDGAPIHVSFVNAQEKSGDSSLDNGDILNVVTRLLGLKDISNIDPSTNFGALGLDSLIAVEIKQILEKATGNPMSVKEIREFTIANLMQLSKNRVSSETDQPSHDKTS